MDLTEEIKKKIDDMPYEKMLTAWRFSPTLLDKSIFQGESGDYFAEVMRKKRDQIGNAPHVSASKSVGWGS